MKTKNRKFSKLEKPDYDPDYVDDPYIQQAVAEKKKGEKKWLIILALTFLFMFLFAKAFLSESTSNIADSDPECIAPEAGFNACY